MIGPRIGIKAGFRAGIAAGVGADPIAPPSGGGLAVTQDATSGIYTPANSTEWGVVTTAAGVGAVSRGWGCQDLAGSLAPSVGAVSLASEGARMTYNNAVAGWSRKGLISTGDGWFSNDASFPDISTTSQLILLYAKVAITGGADVDLLWGGNFTSRGVITSADRLQARNDTTSGLAGAAAVAGAVRPFLLQINRATGTISFSDDQEIVTVAIGGVTGKGLYFVGGLLGDNATILLAADWQGAAAEMTSAQRKSLLQTLGWTIPWS
jgi:hypothetical protein